LPTEVDEKCPGPERKGDACPGSTYWLAWSDKGGVICTLVEVAKGVLYRLACQKLLS